MSFHEYQRQDFIISTDPARIQLDVVHDFLSNQAYWSKGRTKPVIKRSIENSLCFGLYKNHKQIGFARVVTDFAVCALILDVFVLEDYRGLGLGKWLMSCIMEHPDLAMVRKWFLQTLDAHGLYEKFGFTKLKDPDMMMEYIPEGEGKSVLKGSKAI